ncbi:MAG: DMT family transporter [Albidovulum sp.]|jgi:drug/metabolite transporter (DMT)-like permease
MKALLASRHLGMVLVLASTLPFALSGVFVRLIEADVWTVLAWRGLLGGLVILAYAEWRCRGIGRGAFGWRGWVLATVGSVASVAFLGAFRLTFVANVALIYTVAPFVAAFLEWILRREPVRGAVMRSALLATLGVGVIVAGGLGAPHLAGDGLALVMTVLMALYTVLIRAFSGVSALHAGAVSALQLFVLGLVMSDPLAVGSADLACLVAFGLSFALAVVLMTEGARLIPAAEVGLLGGAETPIAVVLAWVILAEAPPLATILGGSIVMGAVGWRAVRDARGGA